MALAVYSVLMTLTAAIALLDVRRVGVKHPWFGIVLAGYSCMAPLAWFAYSWGRADSGAWNRMPRALQWFEGIWNLVTVFSMPAALFSGVLGIANILIPVEARLLRVALWTIALPATLVTFQTGIPGLCRKCPMILAQAGYEIAIPMAILAMIVAVMSLFMPRSATSAGVPAGSPQQVS